MSPTDAALVMQAGRSIQRRAEERLARSGDIAVWCALVGITFHPDGTDLAAFADRLEARMLTSEAWSL